MNKVPLVLYKYSPINKFLYDLLIQNSLWFSCPKHFNDPFDSNVHIGSMQSKAHAAEIANSLKSLKFQTYKNPEIGNFKDNDEELHEGFVDDVKDILNTVGVSCFSERRDSLLMWSHYSNSHKGICLMFDRSDLSESFKDIQQVHYKRKYPKFKTLSDYEFMLLTTKSVDWNYEKEVRIITDTGGLFPFNKIALREVFFGLRTPVEEMHSIIKLMVSLNYSHVKFKQATLSKVDFALKFEKIDEMKFLNGG